MFGDDPIDTHTHTHYTTSSHPSAQCVLGEMRMEREDSHSPPSISVYKMCGYFISFL